MPGHAQTDWFAVAKRLTDPRIGGADPEQTATGSSPDSPAPRVSTTTLTHPQASSAPPSIDWVKAAVWLGGLLFCVAVLGLVGVAIWGLT